MSPRARQLAVVPAVVSALVLAATASATWQSTVTGGPATFAAATVAPPSGLMATSQCVRNVSNDVLLTWTASSSNFVDGYAIYRSANGNPAKQIATVSGIGSTGYTNTGLAFTKTFAYTVRATAGGWSSVDSGSVTITTPNRRCQ